MVSSFRPIACSNVPSGPTSNYAPRTKTRGALRGSSLNVTSWVLLSVAIGVIIYDAIAISVCGVTASVSYDIMQLSKRYPILPFAMGVLIGHLLWPQPK
jgi:hypothetical protein